MKTGLIVVGSLLVAGGIGYLIYNKMKNGVSPNGHITNPQGAPATSQDASDSANPSTGNNSGFAGQTNIGAAGFVSPRFGQGYVSPRFGASGYTWKVRNSAPAAGRKLDKSNQEFQDLKKQGLRK